MYICGEIYILLCAHVEARGLCHVPFSTAFHLIIIIISFLDRVSHWNSLISYTVWPGNPLNLPLCTSYCWDYLHVPSNPDFYVVVGLLNLGPHAYSTNTLPLSHLSDSHFVFFFFDTESITVPQAYWLGLASYFQNHRTLSIPPKAWDFKCTLPILVCVFGDQTHSIWQMLSWLRY